MPSAPPIEHHNPIPTIIDEDKLKGNSCHLYRHPSQAEVDAVKERIDQMKTLSTELSAIGIDFQELTHLIAINLYYKGTWESTRSFKARSKDRTKKVVKRWDERMKKEPDPSGPRKGRPPREYDRNNHLKALTETVAKEVFVKEDVDALGCSNRHRPYLNRLIYDLKELFEDKTDRPFRYIGAIFNAFNFHPESFCRGCRSFDPDSDLCKRKNIFTCPSHKKSREKVRKMTYRIGTEIPPIKYPR